MDDTINDYITCGIIGFGCGNFIDFKGEYNYIDRVYGLDDICICCLDWNKDLILNCGHCICSLCYYIVRDNMNAKCIECKQNVIYYYSRTNRNLVIC